MLKPSQAPYTLNRFFQHMKEAVKYFDNSGNINLNTFIWVDTLSDIISENLGADIRFHNSDYFYSKRYDKKKSSILEIAAPVLLVQEIGGTFENLHKESNRPTQIAHRVRMTLLDNYVNSKDQNSTKQDRELPDIYRDCRIILRKALKYLNSVKYCTITHLDSSTESGYFNTDLLTYRAGQSEITSFIAKETAVNEYFKSMVQLNTNLQYDLVSPIGGANLAGVQIEFSLVENICETVVFDFTQAGNDFVYGNK